MPLATNASGRVHGLQEIRRRLPETVMGKFPENNQALFFGISDFAHILCQDH